MLAAMNKRTLRLRPGANNRDTLAHTSNASTKDMGYSRTCSEIATHSEVVQLCKLVSVGVFNYALQPTKQSVR